MSKNLRTITVAQLIERLQGEDPEARVIFTADYGDYHHTQQALPITGDIDEVEVVENEGYSRSGFALLEEDDEDDTDEARATFLVIR